jgi:hypothetical protein
METARTKAKVLDFIVFEVFTDLLMKAIILVICYGQFGRACCLHLQGSQKRVFSFTRAKKNYAS